MTEQKKLCLYSTENNNGVNPLEEKCRGCLEIYWDGCELQKTNKNCRNNQLKEIGSMVKGLANHFQRGYLE